jgi:hypothetical protein
VLYSPQPMTAYNVTRANTLSPAVTARKAARKKVIERAQRIERKSYGGPQCQDSLRPKMR